MTSPMAAAAFWPGVCDALQPLAAGTCGCGGFTSSLPRCHGFWLASSSDSSFWCHDVTVGSSVCCGLLHAMNCSAYYMHCNALLREPPPSKGLQIFQRPQNVRGQAATPRAFHWVAAYNQYRLAGHLALLPADTTHRDMRCGDAELGLALEAFCTRCMGAVLVVWLCDSYHLQQSSSICLHSVRGD
jgi:hypothetical protein